MATLVLVLYLIGIIALIILGIAFLNNLIQLLAWLWRRKYHYTNTDYESKMINKHKRLILYALPIILVLSIGLYLYNSPLKLEYLIGYETDKVANVLVERLGNAVSQNSYALEGEELKRFIETLEMYDYKRSFTASSLGNSASMLKGAESIYVSINTKDFYNYVNMIFTNEGYIYISGNNQAFKVDTEDKEAFYTRLIDTFRSDESSVLDKIKAELGKIPEKYDSETAIKDGCFVVVHGMLRSEAQIIEEFALNKRNVLTIVQYTIEGDPIITKLAYDGDKYIGIEDNTRDKFAAQIDQRLWEFEFKYLKVYEDKGSIHYYLVDDNELTYEEIMKKLLSSQFVSPIKFKFLCSFRSE